MASARKVIITCAVTGSIHTPSMSPYLPVTPDEITTAALGAAEAGVRRFCIYMHAIPMMAIRLKIHRCLCSFYRVSNKLAMRS